MMYVFMSFVPCNLIGYIIIIYYTYWKRYYIVKNCTKKVKLA
jgi:hypothetical protein